MVKPQAIWIKCMRYPWQVITLWACNSTNRHSHTEKRWEQKCLSHTYQEKSSEKLGGGTQPTFQNLPTLFMTKICDFPIVAWPKVTYTLLITWSSIQYPVLDLSLVPLFRPMLKASWRAFVNGHVKKEEKTPKKHTQFETRVQYLWVGTL